MKLKHFSVLVVEDEKLIAKNIAKNIPICNEAFQVAAIAYDGREALDYVEKLMPDLVITDICMPDMGGIELINRLSRDYPQIKKIIVSGHDDFAYAKSAIENRTVNYLLKPVNYGELKETLDKLEKDYALEKEDIFELIGKKEYDVEHVAELLKDYLLKHYMDQIDFTAIASKLGYSLSYLTKLFAKYIGTSPGRFLKTHRIMLAKQLLKDPSYSVKDVAELVGIPDQFYFSKTFKQVCGVTPSQYKNKE